MKPASGICSAVIMLCATVTRAHPLSPLIINPINNHSYLLLDKASWKDSEAEAVAFGGHLATVRNQAEEDWIYHTFGGYDGEQHLLWIGLSDIAKKFHFSWSSGESASYTEWAPGEPNNAGPHGEDYVAIYYPNHDQRNNGMIGMTAPKTPIDMLEATTNLAQPFTMFGYSETTNIDLGVISVTITNPDAQMFFRLSKP